MRSLALAASVLVSSVLAAQDRPTGDRVPALPPGAFFPDAYTLFVDLDFEELRASGWLAAARKGGLAAHLDRLLAKAGLGVEDLNRITLAGSSSDWTRLGAVLQGSPALAAKELAGRFAAGRFRTETVGGVEILVPDGKSGAAPSAASPAPGQVVLGPLALLQAAFEGREEGLPSEFLVACLPARATLRMGTSQEEALADLAKLLAAGTGIDLAGASISLTLMPELTVEVRLRVLEEATAPVLMGRLKGRIAQLRKDLLSGGWKEAARLLGRAELTRQGAMVVATVAGGEEDTPAAAGPLFGELARALGPATGAAAPVR